MRSEEELNNLIAEWLGFTSYTTELGRIWWVYPDGFHRREQPDFPHSLDALFKWAVKPDWDVEFWRDYSRTGYNCFLHSGISFNKQGVFGETPALALARAIEKLIDEEVKDGN